MTKQHLCDIVKLDTDAFMQWESQIQDILINEYGWPLVCGRLKCLVVPLKDSSQIGDAGSDNADKCL
jgi:hypothetical protein